jgi:hypothetical protein
VAGVEPGLIRQLVEDLVFDVVDERREVVRVAAGVPDPARECASSVEEVPVFAKRADEVPEPSQRPQPSFVADMAGTRF